MWRVRRLHVQFYLAILATFVVLLIASAVLWNIAGQSRGDSWSIETATQVAEAVLPPASASAAEQQQTLEKLRQKLRVDLAVYDARGNLLAMAGYIPRVDPQRLAREGWAFSRRGPYWNLQLSDGRTLLVQGRRSARVPGAHVFIVLSSIVLAFALGAYPIARRLTRRLARLQVGVEQLGAGDLATRVPVEGHDELAALARSFNASAERIEELVKSHKLLLANCSHELRTPLARIRLGLERMSRESSAELHAEVARSIAELDALIGEMLLTSRLGALRGLERSEDVDLLALAAEEAAHFDCSAEGTPTIVRGDPSLLRRMVRNLLENAQRHAGGATRVYVGPDGTASAEQAAPDRRAPGSGIVHLSIEDRGSGVPPEEREKIFEPFHRSAHATAAAKGFGLGLALVRQIARAHGGDVHYAPLSPTGSRFTVTLPRG